jgi:hypothetical protein
MSAYTCEPEKTEMKGTKKTEYYMSAMADI